MSKPLKTNYQICYEVNGLRLDLPIQFNAQDDILQTETVDLNAISSDEEEENRVLKIDLDKNQGEIETVEIVGLNFSSIEPSSEPVRFEVVREKPSDFERICNEVLEVEDDQQLDLQGPANVESLKQNSGLVISNVESISQNNEIQEEEILYECHTCEKKFRSDRRYMRHRCRKCHICGNMFSEISKVRKHLENIHKIYSRFNCDLCGTTFKSRLDVYNHMNEIHLKIEERFKCNLCNKRYRMKNALQKHIKTHEDNLIECGICEKKMKQSRFDEHLKKKHTNSNTQIFSCHFCNMTFTTLRQLDRHLENHSVSFECGQCERRFAKKCHLKEHLIWHSNNNAFTCEYCGEKFELKCNLKSHIKLHDRDVVKLNCSKCPYSTDDMERFIKHGEKHVLLEEREVRRMETDKLKRNWLKCEKCSLLVKNKLKLASHYWKKHKEAILE